LPLSWKSNTFLRTSCCRSLIFVAVSRPHEDSKTLIFASLHILETLDVLNIYAKSFGTQAIGTSKSPAFSFFFKHIFLRNCTQWITFYEPEYRWHCIWHHQHHNCFHPACWKTCFFSKNVKKWTIFKNTLRTDVLRGTAKCLSSLQIFWYSSLKLKFLKMIGQINRTKILIVETLLLWNCRPALRIRDRVCFCTFRDTLSICLSESCLSARQVRIYRPQRPARCLLTRQRCTNLGASSPQAKKP
jgi:hypothetical protein